MNISILAIAVSSLRTQRNVMWALQLRRASEVEPLVNAGLQLDICNARLAVSCMCVGGTPVIFPSRLLPFRCYVIRLLKYLFIYL